MVKSNKGALRKIVSLYAAVIATLFLCSSQVSAMQLMLKTQDWYCFGFSSDFKTILDLDYMITGVNPEQVEFEARQSGKTL